MSWGYIISAVVGGLASAYGQHEENKSNEKADEKTNAQTDTGKAQANAVQQEANMFGYAQMAPWMQGGMNAWNAMQEGMGGDGAFNNFDPAAAKNVPLWTLPEHLSGQTGGWSPNTQPSAVPGSSAYNQTLVNGLSDEFPTGHYGEETPQEQLDHIHAISQQQGAMNEEASQGPGGIANSLNSMQSGSGDAMQRVLREKKRREEQEQRAASVQGLKIRRF